MQSIPGAESVPPLTPPAAAPAPSRRLFPLRLWLAAGLVFLAAAGVLLFWNVARPEPPVADGVRPFATARGQQGWPAFSPDGQMLAFDWHAPEDRHQGIYVQRLDATSPVRLSKDGAGELRPVWSPDGSQIAFLRDSGNLWSIVTTPLVGREEHKWTDFRKGATPWLDWSRDGKWFAFAERVAPGHPPAVVLYALANGQRRTLTDPPPGWRGDSEAVFSPDSRYVAFRRTKVDSGDEDLYIAPVAGGPARRVTFDEIGISAFTFTPDGGLLFSSLRASSIHRLWWKGPHGNALSLVTSAAADAVSPAVSRDGKHLAFAKIAVDVNIWRIASDGSGPASPVIDSEFPDTSPRFSPDGRRIAFHSVRGGTHEIWVSDANGAGAVQLTDGKGANLGNPSWSPDGRQIAFEWWPNGKPAIYAIASTGGSARPLAADAFRNSVPSWPRDGRFVYYTSNRGGTQEIWRVSSAGGAPERVIQSQGSAPEESPDGHYLYFRYRDRIARTPLRDGMPEGPEETVAAGLESGDWGNWVPANDGVYYVQRRRGSPDGAIFYQPVGGKPPRLVYTMLEPPVAGGGGLAISPDGKTLLFAQVDRDSSDIFVQ